MEYFTQEELGIIAKLLLSRGYYGYRPWLNGQYTNSDLETHAFAAWAKGKLTDAEYREISGKTAKTHYL